MGSDVQERYRQPGGLPEARSWRKPQLTEQAPSPGLFDMPVHSVHRRHPLQEHEILFDPWDLCGRSVPGFNLVKQV